jgi:hypothetical protein
MGFHHRELSSGDTVPHSFGQEVSFRKRLWEEKKAATSGASACASTSCLGLVRLVLGIVFLSYSAEHNAAALLVEECAECAMWLNGQGTLLLVMGIAGFIVALVEAAGGIAVVFILATNADPEGPVLRKVSMVKYIVRGVIGVGWGIAECVLFGWSVYGMVYFFTRGEHGAPVGCEEIFKLGYVWSIVAAVLVGSLCGLIALIMSVVCIVLLAFGGVAGAVSLVRSATQTLAGQDGAGSELRNERDVIERMKRRASATGGASSRALEAALRAEKEAAQAKGQSRSVRGSADAPISSTMRARWAFVAAQPDELSFAKGAVLINVNRSAEHMEQWATGTLLSGEKSGLFPLNYVEPFAGDVDEARRTAAVTRVV